MKGLKDFQEHRRYAEQLLDQAQEPDNLDRRDSLIAEAQVHATIAIAIATWTPAAR